MFKLATNNEVWWRIDLPDRDGNGEVVMVPVRFRLRIYTRQEMQARKLNRIREGAAALADAMTALTQSATPEAVETAHTAVIAAVDAIRSTDNDDVAELADRICGWNPADVVDAETGAPVEFTTALRDALLSDEARFKALRDGLLEASRGARSKNSLPGPAGRMAEAQAGATTDSGRATTH